MAKKLNVTIPLKTVWTDLDKLPEYEELYKKYFVNGVKAQPHVILPVGHRDATCRCCAMTTDHAAPFRGVFVSTKQPPKKLGAICSSSRLADYGVKTQTHCYTDPESGKSFYYTIAIENASSGDEITQHVDSEREEDDDDDY